MPFGMWSVGGCNCSCSTTICVQCGGVAVSGASVTIKSGSTTISSGSTGGGGCVTLAIPGAGSYTVVITSGSGNSTTTQTLACNGTTTIDVCAYICGTCAIPAENLTVSWTNLILGPGSTSLIYSSSGPSWTSACSNQLIYGLSCSGGQVGFRVTYFTSGVCPTGASQSCSTLGTNPFKLTQTGLTCGTGSFSLSCSLTSTTCPNLAANGYTGFTVSYP